MERVFTMFTTVLFLAAVLCYVTVSGQTLDQTLDSADQQLNELTSRVASLSDRLDAFLKEAEAVDVTAKYLSKKMDYKQGKRGACKKYYFPCGPGSEGSVQCVRDYLVCDRYKDCRNGADEDPEICNSFPFKTPRTGSGRMIKTDCLMTRKLKGGRVTDDSKARGHAVFMPLPGISWFPSRPQLAWRVVMQFVSPGERFEMFMPLRGAYDYATGELIPMIPKGFTGAATRMMQENPEPGVVRYRLEMDDYWSTFDKEEDACTVVVVTVNN